jgi:alpha-methylacyl-CoA racemase
LADLTGAERVVSASLLVLLNRARGRGERHAEVALADAVRMLAAPLEHDITTANGPLGGMDPLYAIYESSDAWIALAALEPHFAMRLLSALGIAEATTPSLAAVFRAGRALTPQRSLAHRAASANVQCVNQCQAQ